MTLSRRNLLRSLGAGASATIALPEAVAAMLRSPRASERGAQILLNRNENAYGPSPKAIAAIEAGLSRANRFPGAEVAELTEKIAALHKVKPEQVVLGCGSSEIFRLAAAAFLGRGKKLVVPEPSYGVIADYARAVGAEVSSVPLTHRFAHDLDGMLARCDSSTGLVYVCNPNNPTASLTLRKDLDAFLEKLPARMPVLMDEAYHHYVGATSSYESFLDRPARDGRVIVTRTFSKIYGLAALRVGYAVASPEMGRRLATFRTLDGVSALAARAAAGALDDPEFVATCAKRNTDDRQEFFNQVNERMLRGIDSLTNFAMLNTGRPNNPDVVAHLAKNNILVGPLVPSMPKYIRVSLGTPEEMIEFWRVMELLPGHPMAM